MRAPVALLVDDEPFVLDFLCRLMETAGFTPQPEHNSLSVLDRFRRDNPELPSLVISDINMPGLDGVQMVRRLRAICPGLPAVFITGNHELASQASPVGEVVLKPFSVDSLVSAARRAVLSSALDAALQLTGAPKGNLQLLDPETRALQIRVHRGFGPAFLGFFNSVGSGHAACGTALEQAGQVVVEDVRSSPVFSPPALKTMLDAEALSVQSTPLISQKRVLGMLSTHWDVPRQFEAGELESVKEVAGRAAQVLERFEL